MATLPAQQRHALLRREVDGVSHAALAVELGVSPQATKNLVHRARTNLVKQRAGALARLRRRARATCSRRTTRAAARPPRPIATSRRARECRRFRGGLRDTRQAAAILMPMPLMVGRLRAADRQGGRGDRQGRDGQGRRHRRRGRGDHRGRGRRRRAGLPPPATRRRSRRRAARCRHGSVAKGGALPEGHGDRAPDRLADRRRRTTIALACPPGLRVADLIGARGASASYAPGTVVGVEPQRARRGRAADGRQDRAGDAAVQGAGPVGLDRGRVGRGRGERHAAEGRSSRAPSCSSARAAPRSARSASASRCARPAARATAGAQIVTDTGETGWVRERSR